MQRQSMKIILIGATSFGVSDPIKDALMSHYPGCEILMTIAPPNVLDALRVHPYSYAIILESAFLLKALKRASGFIEEIRKTTIARNGSTALPILVFCTKFHGNDEMQKLESKADIMVSCPSNPALICEALRMFKSLP